MFSSCRKLPYPDGVTHNSSAEQAPVSALNKRQQCAEQAQSDSFQTNSAEQSAKVTKR